MAAKRSTAVIRLEDGRVRVFVSYNRADQDVVEAMVDELRKAGHNIWLDALLRPGQLWWSEILDEIERADVVVLALSPEYLSAEACTAERRYAARLRRPVLPIAIRPIAIGALPGDLAGIQVCGSVKDLVGTLRRQKPPPPLPRPMPERPRPPLSELALMRDRMKEVPLDESVQFAIIAELILASRTADGAERDTARLLLADCATSKYLFQRPARLLHDELNKVPQPAPRPPPPPSTPRLVIAGAALGGIALFSFLSLLRVYNILPRPYEVVGPHAVLVVAGTAMCVASLRRHRGSALFGLTICLLGALAVVADLIKNSGFL